MLVRVFAGFAAGAHAPQLISFDDAISASLFLCCLVILSGLRCHDVVVGILLGLVLTGVELASVARDRIAAAYVGDSLVVTCRIDGFPIMRTSGIAFVARCRGSVELPRKVRLTWREPPVRVYPGDCWQLEVRLKRVYGLSNPGGFDAQRSAALTGIGAAGYVVDGVRNRLLASPDAPLDRLRTSLADRIARRLAHRDSAAVVTALAVGSRHAMTEAQWQRYAASGTTHLVAISGLHIGLVAAFAALFGRALAGALRLRVNQRRLALVFAVAAALGYTALSGFGVPAQRACLMLIVAAMAWAATRETSGFRVLAIAGILVALLDPLAVLSAGYALSFLAVATLIWISRIRAAEVPATAAGKLKRTGSLWLSVQFALFVALFSITAAHFGRVSLTAPAVNLLAVPLFSFVTVPATLLSILSPGTGNTTLAIAALTVEWLDGITERLAVAVPLVASHAASLPAAVAVATWVLLPPGCPGRLLAPACLAPLLLPMLDRPAAGCVETTFFDVGQGTAILVETPDHRLLYDTGPAYQGGGSAMRVAVLPYLQSAGIRHIDRVLISHADLDHSGGLDALRSAVAIDHVLSGEPLDGHYWSACHANQAWIWDGIHFEVLMPSSSTTLAGNDASCVLQIRVGEHSVLLTGDIEAAAERLLLQQALRPVTLLSVPHHGSRTSSIPALVETLTPDFAVVSAGFDNRWGLPDQAVVRRWADAGAKVLSTAIEGATTFRLCLDDDVSLVSRHRRDRMAPWRTRPPADPVGATENF